MQMRCEPKIVKKKDFPECGLTAEGMKVLELESRYDYCDIWLNVPYAHKDGLDLHLHIITPPGVFPDDLTAERTEQTYPAVVYCVGSAWMKQNMGHMISRLEDFCKRGYIIALAEYRPSTAALFPAQIKDLKTAVRFMADHAKEYAVDTDRIYVWGDSSGGHTATMVNITWEDPGFNDEEGNLPVKAFVDFYGPSDLTAMNDQPSIMDHMSPESPEGCLIGGRRVDEHPEWTSRVNPVSHLHKGMALRPQLIMHGSRDRLVPFEQSVLLYNKMKECGMDVEFYKLKGADHAEDVFFQKPVLDVVDAFFRKY